VTDIIEQGSPEWVAIRLGRATGSRIGDVMAQGKSGAPSASRANYRAQLVAERLTGVMVEGYTSEAMERGKEVEIDAKRAYSFRTGRQIAEAGFYHHPTISMSGASPDGLVGDDGLVEVKCPNTSTHIDTLRGGSIPRAYQLQMLWEMVCAGRQWCDFVSFDPRLPESMTLSITRVNRNAEWLAEVEAEVVKFLKEVDETVADLRRRYEPDSLREALVASLDDLPEATRQMHRLGNTP
jgi:putative phage-type endonuclease